MQHNAQNPRFPAFRRARVQLYGLAVAITLMVGWAALFGGSPVGAAQSNGALPAGDGQVMRVGVYDSRAVAVAFVRSDLSANLLKDLRLQHAQAKEKGDRSRIDELDAAFKTLQIRRHLQGFSTAPIEDVMAYVEDQIPAIAQRHNVIVITREVDYHDDDVQVVDITDALVQLFSPDDETLDVIRELRQRDPEPIEVIAQLPAIK